jgi:hypothetical protein
LSEFVVTFALVCVDRNHDRTDSQGHVGSLSYEAIAGYSGMSCAKVKFADEGGDDMDFPQMSTDGRFPLTSSFCTEVHGSCSLRSECLSEKSHATLDACVPKNEDPVLSEEDLLIQRLVFRFHPAMEAPGSAKGLTVDTTKSRPVCAIPMASASDFPRYPSIMTQPMFSLADDCAPRPAVPKPAKRSVDAPRKAGKAGSRWGHAFSWLPCGADCTAAVVPAGDSDSGVC